jgi:hypothetical protein
MLFSTQIPDKIRDGSPETSKFIKLLDELYLWKLDIVLNSGRIYNPVLLNQLATLRKLQNEFGWPPPPADFTKKQLDNMYLNAENVFRLKGSKLGFEYWIRVLTCGDAFIDDLLFFPRNTYIILDDYDYGYLFAEGDYPNDILYLFSGETTFNNRFLYASIRTPYYDMQALKDYMNTHVYKFIGFVDINTVVKFEFLAGPFRKNTKAYYYFEDEDSAIDTVITLKHDSSKELFSGSTGATAVFNALNLFGQSVGTVFTFSSPDDCTTPGNILGTYTVQSGDTTATILRNNIVAAITASAAVFGYTISSGSGTNINITGPLSCGALLNGKLFLASYGFSTSGAFFSGGVNSSLGLTITMDAIADIDWGDGVIQTNVNFGGGGATHTYSSVDVRNIRIYSFDTNPTSISCTNEKGLIEMNGNLPTSLLAIVVTNCPNLVQLPTVRNESSLGFSQITAPSCSLPGWMISRILVELDKNGRTNGNVSFANQTSAFTLTPYGVIAKNNLVAKGWTVTL